MTPKLLVAASLAALLSACTQPAPQCEAGADAGGPEVESRVHFVNLGREPVTVTLEGEDAGTLVQPLGTRDYVGPRAPGLQRGTVTARNYLPDGGREPVALPFEFEATAAGEAATFVLRDSMPTRLSTSFTVARQTQGATFGEKVNQGLANVEIEGGVDTGGDCQVDLGAPAGTPAKVSLRDDTTTDCDSSADRYFTRPVEVSEEATPYFVHGKDELLVAWVEPAKVNAGLHAAGGALAQGASLLGGALPGGAVISAAVGSLYVLNAHGAHQAVSVSLEGVVVAENLPPGALVRVKPTAIASAARKMKGKVVQAGDTGMLAQVSVGGAAPQTFSFGAQEIGPCKPPYLCDFLNGEDTLLTLSEDLDSSATVLKSERKGWDGVVKGGSRLFVAATTSSVESRGCVAVVAGDDTCVMGAARVSALGGAGGGASSAAYAATGRLLYPPAKVLGKEPTRFGLDEQVGGVTQRFLWSDPPGLTPVQGTLARGFAIVAAGNVADAAAADQRTFLFVDTSAVPWRVSAPMLSTP